MMLGYPELQGVDRSVDRIPHCAGDEIRPTIDVDVGAVRQRAWRTRVLQKAFKRVRRQLAVDLGKLGYSGLAAGLHLFCRLLSGALIQIIKADQPPSPPSVEKAQFPRHP